MRGRPRNAVLLAAIGAAATLSTATPAQAGTYPMRSCNVPGHAPTGTGPWVWTNSSRSTTFNHCAGGGGFGFAFPAAREIEPRVGVTLHLVRPPSGPAASISIRRVRLWMTARLDGTGSALFLLARAYAGSAMQQTDIHGPPGGSSLETPWSSPTYGATTDKFDLVLLCSNSSYDYCYPQATHPIEVRGADVLLSEDVPPQPSITGGPLLSGQPQSGAQGLTLNASDGESGVARVEAILGGRVAGSQDFVGTAQCRYDGWNACDTTVSNSFSVDTTLVPDGSHTLQLRVTDAAGNQRIVQHNALVAVRNQPGTQATVTAVPSANGTRITARFVGRKGSRLTVNWSKSARIIGTVTDRSGLPMGGVAVGVEETSLVPGAKPRSRGSVRSDARGRFGYSVSPRGSSRRIRFSFSSGSAAATRDVRLNVRAATSLRVSLRGVRVRYEGRLRSKPIPRKGKLVLLQGRAIGGAWQTFATRRASRTGTFKGRYRLRVRRPGVRLQFRVRVPAERGYAYSPSTGAPVTKRVR